MKPFRKCPRCDNLTLYLLKRNSCDKCGFYSWQQTNGQIGICEFSTDKFDVVVYVGRTQIRTKVMRAISSGYPQLGKEPIIIKYIPKELSPKITDDDIDRLLILL